MADTVFKADFRGSWTLDTTGLNEEDSSVEIYMENILKREARHKGTRTHTHNHKSTAGNREDKYKHMHVNEQDSTGKGTDDRETEDMC